jgi:hypothetical protein
MCWGDTAHIDKFLYAECHSVFYMTTKGSKDTFGDNRNLFTLPCEGTIEVLKSIIHCSASFDL